MSVSNGASWTSRYAQLCLVSAHQAVVISSVCRFAPSCKGARAISCLRQLVSLFISLHSHLTLMYLLTSSHCFVCIRDPAGRAGSRLLIKCKLLLDPLLCLPQHSSGVSRDEIAAALIEVAEGRVPKDRVALRELHREIMQWPFLDAEDELEPEGSVANYEGITETGTPLHSSLQLLVRLLRLDSPKTDIC